MLQETNAVKDDIRATHRRRRATLTPAQLEVAGAALAAHGEAWATAVTGNRPGIACVYLGVGHEPPTLPLIHALHRSGQKVLLPVCEPGRELSWVFWTPDTGFERSRYAPILEPAGLRHGPETAGGAAMLFIPATAVDLAGNRIGQGGGYYDKFLGHLATAGKEIPLAAVIYDDELLPAGRIPAEEFDRPVPAVLAPSGYRPLAGGA
ncbi:5-formyltetrahydrofolate cyclo-ligase [Arthrobacter ulcerisalmonis]|uniref:5-formyltetrahydrofolate cyclo-ligase n=1 Tax=Arthrobacter sp. B1I2 TaxID=3042263 RepID=UPI0027844FA0|nr:MULTISPECIES: 5-formyltetrahydrofolate cyclo-ligase [Arthrobacter]MDQ0663584.1 5-formyltetrahydrofolate cyclo-ligase [Arthrobacter ulcerisalmonis]MDQ0731467.1 5-formyltetrahydrofolate cyclo-ligase [Arthrobacter sp. B1I2]